MNTFPDNSFFVSGTFLDAYNSCPRKGEIYKLLNRVSAQPSAAATFGTHMHSALALHYRQREFGTPADVVREKVARMLERAFTEQPIPEGDEAQAQAEEGEGEVGGGNAGARSQGAVQIRC